MSIIFLVLYFAQKTCDHKTYRELFDAIQTIPNIMSDVLSREEEIIRVARNLAGFSNCFFLGRGFHVPIALEGSLKCKEISYIHSESYPAGELKHGSLALIQNDFPVVILMPNDYYYEYNLSSVSEIQARGGKVCVLTDLPLHSVDWTITLPSAHRFVMPFATTVAVQLLAYHCAKFLGRDIDKPRNLAKSVTVR